MDEEQGKVIDGTERARQWRRSRSGSTAVADTGKPHSEAPKSIASSLLVPGTMLDGAVTTAPGEVAKPADRAGATRRNGEHRDASGSGQLDTAEHENLFLSPDAELDAAPAR